MSSPDPKAAKSDIEDTNKAYSSKQRGDYLVDSGNRREIEALEEDLYQRKEVEGDGEEEEEEGECGFCLFMKGGGCKESFIAWENCVEEAEKNSEDIVTKCMEVTAALKKCMDANADYYEPILKAEKAAEEEAKMELEREKAAEEEAKKESEGLKGNETSSESEKKAES